MKPYPRGFIQEREKLQTTGYQEHREFCKMHLILPNQGFSNFRRAICADVNTAQKIVKAVLALHNFLMYGHSVSTNLNIAQKILLAMRKKEY